MRIAALLPLLLLVACESATGPSEDLIQPEFAKSCTIPGHSNGPGCEAAGQRVLAAAGAMAKVCSGGMSVQCGIAQAAFASALYAYQQTYDAYGHRDGCDVFGVDCSGQDLRSVDIWEDPEWNPECHSAVCEQLREDQRNFWYSTMAVRP